MARWIALALAGLLVAVGVAYAASRLASTKVALTSEPVSAGAKLAPPERKPVPAPRHRRSHGHGGTTPASPPPVTTTTVPPPPARTTPTRPAPSPPRDDSGGGRDD